MTAECPIATGAPSAAKDSKKAMEQIAAEEASSASQESQRVITAMRDQILKARGQCRCVGQ